MRILTMLYAVGAGYLLGMGHWFGVILFTLSALSIAYREEIVRWSEKILFGGKS